MDQDYIGILKEMAEEMYNAVWSKYEGASGLDFEELGRLLDYASADAALNYLLREGLRFKVISEEWRSDYSGSESPILIIDPIDGTNNMARNIPFSSISLSFSRDYSIDGIFAAVVKDIFKGSTYWAVKGRGAYRDNRPIHTSGKMDLDRVMISINIGRARAGVNKGYMIIPRVKLVRSLGSSELELAYVAEGRIDGFIDVRGKLRIYDFSAGYLLVNEAGGESWVNHSSGSMDIRNIYGFSIIAASSRVLMEKILNIIGK